MKITYQDRKKGIIELLPALPKDWSEGEVSGLRARGGFEVSMRWQKGKVVETTIKNCGPKASEVTIKYNGQQQTIHMNIGETKKI